MHNPMSQRLAQAALEIGGLLHRSIQQSTTWPLVPATQCFCDTTSSRMVTTPVSTTFIPLDLGAVGRSVSSIHPQRPTCSMSLLFGMESVAVAPHAQACHDHAPCSRFSEISYKGDTNAAP